jgi:predicted PhzF superfamily epimerase YddE/YHI9
MDFPAIPASVSSSDSERLALEAAIGAKVVEVLTTKRDYIAVLEDEEKVKKADPSQTQLLALDRSGVIITARGSTTGVDFVSRAFFPKFGVPEDPVCGSAHCEMAPYWSKKLGKTIFKAHQVSARGGVLDVELKQDRVMLGGFVSPYLQGIITVPKE